LDTVRSKAPLLGHLIGVACEGTGAAVGALVGGGSTIPLGWAGDHACARQLAREPTVREVASDGIARVELGPEGVPHGFLAAQPVATAGEPAVLYVAGGRAPDIERVRLVLRALAAAIERRLRVAADPEAITAPLGVAIADARYSPTPLVFVDSGFCRMTGYEPGELHGWSAAFLQGSQRDQAGRWRLQGAVARGEACTATLQNYRRDGRRFTNRVALTPVHADDGAITHFVAVVAESPATEPGQPIRAGAAVDPLHSLDTSPARAPRAPAPRHRNSIPTCSGSSGRRRPRGRSSGYSATDP
jgi:PAS domain S-box-containing protein